MSHNPEAVIDCPNCGYKAQYNYCARCGQATHLHKDTFWGLIVHFVAHYFHYDSKFWNTIKMLWTKPGALTIAYRNKQRMRFIDPISLYIFVSAVFFLIFFSHVDGQLETYEWKTSKNTKKIGSLVFEQEPVTQRDNNTSGIKYDSEIERRLDKGTTKTFENKESFGTFIKGFIHHAPKAVFFMIPIMALILKLLFIRRKEAYFVDHGIFSLHFHTYWFSLMLLWVINPFSIIKEPLNVILRIASAVYFVIALKKVYSITIVRSIFYSLIIGSFYFVFLLIVALGGFAYMLYQQG